MGCEGLPRTSSAHFCRTRLKYNSRTWDSWLAERGSGVAEGLGVGVDDDVDGGAIIAAIALCRRG